MISFEHRNQLLDRPLMNFVGGTFTMSNSRVEEHVFCRVVIVGSYGYIDFHESAPV
jgi:hypothetical protein